MIDVRIMHSTVYRYDRPVVFGEHRLMLRPRDGHDMRILDSSLRVSPQADVRWAYDTFGNSIALLSFHASADELRIESELRLRRYGFDDPLTRIRSLGGAYPFAYDPDDAADLAPMLALLHPEESGAVRAWLAGLWSEPPRAAVGLLHGLSVAIHEGFGYRRRVEYGVQSPAETISLGSGTCRDFALLMMEAARSLGFAARFVTGYLFEAGETGAGAMQGGGSTHAWAEIFLSSVGWVAFDPTNKIVAGRGLIQVATTRAPAQAAPVSGTFEHEGASMIDMAVSVTVASAA